MTHYEVDKQPADFEDLVLETLRRTRVPGLSVAIVHADKVVYLKGFGLRQVGKPEPVDPDTVFQLASLSKPIASTVVAALVGDGLVTWDDPIRHHFPDFAMHDSWVTSQVTLRDMFCHRSGLPDHAGDRLEDIGYERTEILHRLRHGRPDSSFRSHYEYTNFGLTAAAVAAARAAGGSWEDVSARRLYQPLGMDRTSSRFSDFTASQNHALGHVRQDSAWVAKYTRNADAQSPAGGVSSSARDMASWLLLQLGRGTVGGREIVKPEPLDETHRPEITSRASANPSLDRPTFYGLGWNVSYDEEGRIRWSHSGAFSLGAATCVNVLPAQQIGIAVLSNSSPIGVPEALCNIYLDLALSGKVERDWVGLFEGVLAKSMAPDYGTAVDYSKTPKFQSPPLSRAAYVGHYNNDLFGPVEIVATDADLMLRLGPKQNSFALSHFERDVFTYQPQGENAYGPSAVTFTIGADGRATRLTIENLDVNGQGTFSRASSRDHTPP